MVLNVLLAVFLLAPMAAFAVEASVEKAGDLVVSAPEPQKNSVISDFPQTDHDAFNERAVLVNEVSPEPVATVAGVEKKEATALSVKTEPAKKTSPKGSSEKKEAETSDGSGTAAKFETKEMEKRWKALFSKEAASGSVIYTVKPGDSLYVLARKNHTTVEFIKKINKLKSDDIYIGKKLKIHTAPFSIVVDKSANTLVLYSEDAPVRKYSVATGKNNCTPVGDFKITDKLVHPTWFKTGAILPPGSPENGLGTRWMGFDKPSYGIHGTIEPKSIGTQASEGCIRMLNKDVEELYSLVPVGSAVTIQD